MFIKSRVALLFFVLSSQFWAVMSDVGFQKKASKNTVENTSDANVGKKKILILMSKGGAGHISVSNALKGYLDKDYDISVVNLIGDVMKPVDVVNTMSFGKFTGEDFYNFCLQVKWTGVVNLFAKVGAWGINYKEEEIVNLITDFIKKDKPDLIISVIPMVNNAVLKVAKKFKLPFIVVTNDLDTTNYINGISCPRYRKFYYTLPFDDSDMWKKIEPAKIPKEQVKVTGFPLRKQFFEETADKKSIRKDFAVPENKKVIMLLMGGAGSLGTYRYLRAMIRYHKPIHIIVCLGKNENLRRTIEKMNLPKHITISLVGFTQRVADLMSISDILITKPGPGSICEGIASNLPILIDKTNGTLWWEKMNMDLVTKHNFGDLVKSYKDLERLIDKYLADENYIKSIKTKMAKFKKETNFGDSIKQLVKDVLEKDSPKKTYSKRRARKKSTLKKT